MHGLANVTPVKAALSDKTGTAFFLHGWDDGAGLSDTLSYSDGEEHTSGRDAEPGGMHASGLGRAGLCEARYRRRRTECGCEFGEIS